MPCTANDKHPNTQWRGAGIALDIRHSFVIGYPGTGIFKLARHNARAPVLPHRVHCDPPQRTNPMPSRHNIRRLAMQLLYQMEATQQTDIDAMSHMVDREHDADDVIDPAIELASAAWQACPAADAMITALAPDWPTHRQPGVDKAILRLAHYEIVSGHVPVSVAIDQAIELAKEYAAEQSPAFINAVLDKAAKRIQPHDESPPAEVKM